MSPQKTCHPPRLLVIDDSEMIRVVLQRFFSFLGREVETYEDGPSALFHFQANRFRVAVIDVELKKKPNGLEMARTLKMLDPKLKIILTSADPSYKKLVYRRGLGRFIVKPFSPYELERMIQRKTHCK